MRRLTASLWLASVLVTAHAATGQQLQPPATQLPPGPMPAPAPEAVPPEAAQQDDGAPLARLLGGRADRQEVVGNHVRFIGNVELQRPGSPVRFSGDVVDVYIDDNRLEATGNVVFADANGRIAAERVEFNLTEGTGVFYDASGIMAMGSFASPTQFAGQEPDVYFYGEKIEKLPERKYRITKGAFTTCVQPTPRWELTSGTVEITLDDHAFARSTVLRVKGVPVFYLPVMYYPLQESQRATGFLLPSYGTSTYRGQAVSNGFFWAMSRSRDLTVMHDWFT